MYSYLQGLEIVNPQAAEKKVAEANQKYFSNMAEFLKVKKEAKMWIRTSHTSIPHTDSCTQHCKVYFQIRLTLCFVLYYVFTFDLILIKHVRISQSVLSSFLEKENML